MALIQLGPLVANIAGSVGGATFQRGAAGVQVHTRAIPSRRSNALLSRRRSTVSANAVGWRNLTAAERTTWSFEAGKQVWTNRFGSPISGKGYWLYARCNTYAAIAGLARISSATAIPVWPALDSTILQITVPSVLRLVLAPAAALPAGMTLLVFGSPQISAGRASRPSSFRFIQSFSSAAASPLNIRTAYLQQFGPSLLANRIIWLRLVLVDHAGGQPNIISVAGWPTS